MQEAERQSFVSQGDEQVTQNVKSGQFIQPKTSLPYLPGINKNFNFTVIYEILQYGHISPNPIPFYSLGEQESYTVLSGPMLSVPSLPAFVNNTAGFLSTLTDSVYVRTVKEMLQLINNSISTLDRVVLQANQLADAFRCLAENGNLTGYFNAVFANVNSMSEVGSEFSLRLTDDFTNLGLPS